MKKSGRKEETITVGSEVAGHIKISSDGSCWVCFCCALSVSSILSPPKMSSRQVL